MWTYNEVGHTQEAKKELLDFVEFENTDNVLDTLKPTRLIQRMLQVATTDDEEDIVMDFFCGSASTAHAVMKQNREDGGFRHYVMIQFPESFKEPETRLKTIADIGKVRLRSAILRLTHSDTDQLELPIETAEDLGFRVFKLGPSYFEPWVGVEEKEVEAYAKQMELFEDPLVEGWTVDGVLTEIALKHGLSLGFSIETMDLPGAKVYRLVDFEREQSIYVSLEERLDLDSLKGLDLNADDVFICRDAALDDETAANLALQCRLETI